MDCSLSNKKNRMGRSVLEVERTYACERICVSQEKLNKPGEGEGRDDLKG